MLIEKVYRPAVLKAAYHNMILALITNIIKQKVVLKDKRQDKQPILPAFMLSAH